MRKDSETKRERFVRVAESRTAKIIRRHLFIELIRRGGER